MKRFRDLYGTCACIRTFKNGSCRLTIYVNGKLVKGKDYKSEKGAQIALGRFGDSFPEV